VDREITAGVMAAFLRIGRHIDRASGMVLLAAVLLAIQDRSPATVVTLGVVLFTAAVQKYYALRVALDADLFALLYRHPAHTAGFDAALALCCQRDLPARTLEQRWQGARELQLRQLAALLIQCVGLAGLIANICT
jgi:hypothetical protein